MTSGATGILAAVVRTDRFSMPSQVAFFDTECYPNYWLLKVKPQGGNIITVTLYDGQSLTGVDVPLIRQVFERYTVVSFNGLGYDVPMITGALMGYAPAQLKALNDRIIVEQVKPWELGLPDWAPRDHIDVMQVAPGAGSQKQYVGRIHGRTIQDLPYSPGTALSGEQFRIVDRYCETDITELEGLYNALAPQLQQREALSARYGFDLRSKSDAQLAEAVLKRRCEQVTGQRIYKAPIDWGMQFRYNPPAYIAFRLPQLQAAFERIKSAIFGLGANGAVSMPAQIDGLDIIINQGTYRLGIGGLHSQEKRVIHRSDDTYVLLDNDVASYYPSLILNSGAWPAALGRTFLQEYDAIKRERLECKAKLKTLPKDHPDYAITEVGDEGGKIMINGTFGKTGSIYSVLFAPEMLIQTTVTGQLALLMLIEAHEINGIPVVSANTDGILIKCERVRVPVSQAIIGEWQRITGLEMETSQYNAIYSRDINNYIAIKGDGKHKRKGEYSQSGLKQKKNPDCEICTDAVTEYLAQGTPTLYTIAACQDIRKFVTVTKVAGGGTKMWGDGPRKGARVMDMTATLHAHGWYKHGRLWAQPGMRDAVPAVTAYAACFDPQRREYLGKVVRWYYGTRSPGPIVYESNGNTVGGSWGAQPCMVLPDTLPSDIDYAWYENRARGMLSDLGVTI